MGRWTLESTVTVTWSAERTDRLREMWLNGATATEISMDLGGVTRNAVMGKVNRLGLLRSKQHHEKSKVKLTGCCSPEFVEQKRAAANEDQKSKDIRDHETVAIPALDENSAKIDGIEIFKPKKNIGEAVSIQDNDVSNAKPETTLKTVEKVKNSPQETETETSSERSNDPLFNVKKAAELRAKRFAEERARKAKETAPLRDLSKVERIAHESIIDWSENHSEIEEEEFSPASDGVLKEAISLSGHAIDWRTVVQQVEKLTGKAFDANIPAHAASLIAMGSIMCRGDLKDILRPKISEQTVSRMMRRFAEEGVIIAGKPAPRLMETANDKEFYKEMESISAVY